MTKGGKCYSLSTCSFPKRRFNISTLYEVLGIARDATQEEIKRAWKRRAVDTHPDTNPGDADAARRFKDVRAAYGVLSDPEKRRKYDAMLTQDDAPAETETTVTDLEWVVVTFELDEEEIEEALQAPFPPKDEHVHGAFYWPNVVIEQPQSFEAIDEHVRRHRRTEVLMAILIALVLGVPCLGVVLPPALEVFFEYSQRQDELRREQCEKIRDDVHHRGGHRQEIPVICWQYLDHW